MISNLVNIEIRRQQVLICTLCTLLSRVSFTGYVIRVYDFVHRSCLQVWFCFLVALDMGDQRVCIYVYCDIMLLVCGMSVFMSYGPYPFTFQIVNESRWSIIPWSIYGLSCHNLCCMYHCQ